jgi:hypothetical protein
LCKRYMFVWHWFTYLGQGWSAFECHHSNLASELQISSRTSVTSHDSENAGFSCVKGLQGCSSPISTNRLRCLLFHANYDMF